VDRLGLDWKAGLALVLMLVPCVRRRWRKSLLPPYFQIA
jgi:hypothetical protein